VIAVVLGSSGFVSDSLFFLSPVVVDTVVVEREGEELEHDVSHLELDINPDDVDHTFAILSALGTPASRGLEVIVVGVSFVLIVVPHERDHGSDDNQEETDESGSSQSDGNVAESKESIRSGTESPDPEESGNQPDDVVEYNSGEVDSRHHVFSSKSDVVVGSDAVVSVDQVSVVGHVSENQKSIDSPGVATNLFGRIVVRVDFKFGHSGAVPKGFEVSGGERITRLVVVKHLHTIRNRYKYETES